MKQFLLSLIFSGITLLSFSQQRSLLSKEAWVDSVFKSLSKEEKIAQLFIIRSSAPAPAGSFQATFYDKEVEEAIRKYNIGGICQFQGGPRQHAQRVNYFQQIAKTPILVTIDAEWGLGMRYDSVASLPRPMMLGALKDPSLVYEYGRAIAAQCIRAGVHVNYGPVMDVNNNPNNPVINERSFGDDRNKVSEWGVQYIKGMQDMGVMACAKHFPGHGDVSVDSHLDLPVINKTIDQLDSMELYPFRKAIDAGVKSVMVAHLSVPSIDNTLNRPTSISKKAITDLLKNKMGFQGLTFTDALEMKGIAKFYPGGEISLQSILAGNDLLCLPADIPGSIALIKKALWWHKLKWKDIDTRVKKILSAKYDAGLANPANIELYQIVEDLNKDIAPLTRKIAEQAITLVKNDDAVFPLKKGKKIAYLGLGIQKDNAFATQVRKDYDAQVFYFDYTQPVDKATALYEYLKGQFDVVILGIHGYNRRPAKGFGISEGARFLIQQLQQEPKTISLFFGNPYAAAGLTKSATLLACYEDDVITQQVAADILFGRSLAKGTLPISIGDEFHSGHGILAKRLLPSVAPEKLGFDLLKLQKIDSIVQDAIAKRAIPGGVVLVAKDGKIAYEKSFGHLSYDSAAVVYPETIYDMASVTKIMATTLSVMKLYDEGKLDLHKTLGDYLPWVKGTNKDSLKLWDVILHQAGLKAFIPFYRETIDTNLASMPLSLYYSYRADSLHRVRVAENMFLRNDWVDTMYHRIVTSPLSPQGAYLYSDNDFIFLGKIVEAITGQPLDVYAKKTFYDPLGLHHTGFKPRERFPLKYIAPTEREYGFRQQLMQGDVHDPGAAMFGGVAGHAGLFSNAYDLSVLAELLLNGGSLNGIQFFKKETVDYFTAYQAQSRRGLGFDKPEKDNATRPEPYPSLSVSPATFGHTGFTGTCIWMDPQSHLTYIFLSNRVHNNGDANRFSKMNVRPKVQETIYQALQK